VLHSACFVTYVTQIARLVWYICRNTMFMLRFILVVLISALGITRSYTQDFPYELSIRLSSIPDLPGLHSYAFGQHDGNWILIGGSKDGLHSHQPSAAFPVSLSNDRIYLVNPETKQVVWRSVTELSTGLREQLQSTNMNFYQVGDTLYIIGGYGFSTSSNGHITYPYLSSINLAGLAQAIAQNQPITSYFQQITGPSFAVTGGQLGYLQQKLYLIGGHRFDGRYNRNDGPSFTQAYTNAVRIFSVQSSPSLSAQLHSVMTDSLHLHRRDYNLLPQFFADGSFGYTISSGVFQLQANLPFLYPVHVFADSILPVPGFNQYLSHYHGAKVCLHDSAQNAMHNLFFGGMSQYYMLGSQLIQDNGVPFVRTISRLSRYADGNFAEFALPDEMPGFHGASSEFIPNLKLPYLKEKVLRLEHLPQQDSVLLGHIVGGIFSPSLNPFNNNNTASTQADASVFEVWLKPSDPLSNEKLPSANPYTLSASPNPFRDEVTLAFTLPKSMHVHYFVSDLRGSVLHSQVVGRRSAGSHTESVRLGKWHSTGGLILTLVLDQAYYVPVKLIPASGLE